MAEGIFGEKNENIHHIVDYKYKKAGVLVWA